MLGEPRWVAVLRIVVGLWFLKTVWTKLMIASVWGIPVLAVSPRFLRLQHKRVAEFARTESGTATPPPTL